MKWKKLGRIFAPDKTVWWQQHYGILPTPIHLAEKKCIRIFFASTCENKFGRISFLDVDEQDPTKIIYQAPSFVLDTGDIGAFDDCGVNPSAVLKLEGKWLLYYAGYQRHFRAPYSILSGLATSDDGESFQRYKRVPILERTTTELNLRSAPTVLHENGKFQMWYVADFGWKQMASKVHGNKLMPQYCLKYASSANGVDWEANKEPMLSPSGDEFGFGRPFAIKKNSLYKLFYSIRSENKTYRIGYAESNDGASWTRKDSSIGIDVSESGWDSEMVCYPAVVEVKNKTFLFYNGNNNGETGFGVAELMEA